MKKERHKVKVVHLVSLER